MKILLLGEFSAFNQNLLEGLIKHGHDVRLLADGDGWKQINTLSEPLYEGSGNYKKIVRYLSTFNNYDVVQCVNHKLYRRYINNHLMLKIKKNNGIFVMSATGDCSIVYDAYVNHKYRYFVYDEDEAWEKLYDKRTIKGLVRRYQERELFKMADAIIPTAFEYAEAFREFPNCRKSILLPINCDNVSFSQNTIRNDKIVFFHGINRVLAKGSNHIIPAMKKLKENYPNDVEIIINKRMPLAKYLQVMSKVNVVIDQCKVYSRGMNALYAMAEGKVVMGGNEPEDAMEFGTEVAPVINIVPDENQIYSKMIKILENRSMIEEIGYRSRRFVEKYHDSKIIAKQYLKEWRGIKNEN